MAAPFSDSYGASARWSGRRLRLSTLIRLRWLAVAGQTVAIMVVGLWFGFPLPVSACLALISLSAWLNFGLRMVFPAAHRLDPNWATLLLAYDLLQLAGLLYLTGGLQNPFAILLLGPVMVSATTLQSDKTFLLGALTLAAATVLVFIHLPLPWFPGEEFVAPLQYVGGVWVALVCALLFMAFYSFRVAEEARQLADALAATELVLQREQHLSALDGLAAAAAHELGTPLATIALVANELASEIRDGDPHADDIQLIRTQSQRCREILSKITSLSSAPEEHLGRMKLSHILEEITAPHRDFGIATAIDLKGDGPEPVAARNPGLTYGLGNIVDNAVDFAEGEVRLSAQWTPSAVTVAIADDGPGFSPDVIDRLGEPYVTTRRADTPTPGEHGGLGLGFFIAKTLLERSGARLQLANRRAPEKGAVVTVEWPRGEFERQTPGVLSLGRTEA
ncbi:MAG: ActS/PrrB/RegB family redox-sensitive histidine kinase [Rhizobiales bacterium]|nr:ActS/PrrB/RegB family redox-sensitive histidine kinase [Hyphomicrobiales bacterium]MDQ3560022.1 ActS/PrrB/RegB family redox-sensitive histidine kinase [Pseudomonadota bacterium]